MTGLVIKQHWIDLILSGKKTWELRSRRTKPRGRIALIQSGSGTIVGACDLVGCSGPLSAKELADGERFHCVPRERLSEIDYAETYAWELEHPRRLEAPIRYEHPQGAVSWVKLDKGNVGEYARLVREVCATG